MNCTYPDCENPREGTTLFCASHNYENRKAERESKKVKIVKPVKKVSEKRADELLKYPKLKKEFLEHKMICELKFEGCTQKTTQPHHKSILAKHFLNTKTWLAVCLSCHIKLENMPAEERRLKGYLID